jgi:hypothetical protein
MFARIKKFCFDLSTLGPVGGFQLRNQIAPLFAIPFLYFFRMVSAIKPNFIYLFFILLVLFVLIVSHLALGFLTDKNPSNLVINKTFGFFLVLFNIPFGFKFLVAGYVLFLMANTFWPFIFSYVWNINFKNLPWVLGFLAESIIAGVTINIFFRLVVWLVH